MRHCGKTFALFLLACLAAAVAASRSSAAEITGFFGNRDGAEWTLNIIEAPYQADPLSTSSYRQQKMKLEVSGRRYWLRVYYPRYPDRKAPLVLGMPLLPWLSFLMQDYCVDLAKRGMVCAYLDAPDTTLWHWGAGAEDPVSRLGKFREESRQTVLAGQIALDALLSPKFLPGVDPEKVGTFGSSLGGTLAASLAEKDPRVKTLVMLFSGAGYSRILLDSRFKPLQDFMVDLIARADLPPGDAPEAAMKLIDKELGDVDPLNGADALKDKSVIMLNPESDDIMPRSAVDIFRGRISAAGAKVQFIDINTGGRHIPITPSGLLEAREGLLSSRDALEKFFFP